VAVAGAITVGHGHDDDQDHVHDHHRSLPSGAGLDHGKARLSKVVGAVATLAAGLGSTVRRDPCLSKRPGVFLRE